MLSSILLFQSPRKAVEQLENKLDLCRNKVDNTKGSKSMHKTYEIWIPKLTRVVTLLCAVTCLAWGGGHGG
jgi:hypothetical protein